MLVGLGLRPIGKSLYPGPRGIIFLYAPVEGETRRKDKKLIMVPGDLAEQLLQLAGREGKPLSHFVEEQLEQAIRARKFGSPLKDIVNYYEIMESLKSAGAVFTPAEVMSFLVEDMPSGQREKLHTTWHEAGQWYGKYLVAKFSDQVVALGRFLQASRWDLDEVKVTPKERSVEVRCISNGLSMEDTESLRNFVEGIMESLGYWAKKRDIAKGIIHLVFEEGGTTRG